MANYDNQGNRWTAVYLVQRERGDVLTYRKLPWEIVRFNVDTDPDSREVIVPTGEDPINPSGNKQVEDKIYEKIWIVDHVPYADKVWFGKPE